MAAVSHEGWLGGHIVSCRPAKSEQLSACAQTDTPCRQQPALAQHEEGEGVGGAHAKPAAPLAVKASWCGK
jgi:hypothetical protein